MGCFERKLFSEAQIRQMLSELLLIFSYDWFYWLQRVCTRLVAVVEQ